MDEVGTALVGREETRHTPGPWEISQEPPRWIIQAQMPIGKKAVSYMVGDYVECGANARLIAAAPEMLEALKDAAKALAMLVEPSAIRETTTLNTWARIVEVETKARAAISKATDTQPTPQG